MLTGRSVVVEQATRGKEPGVGEKLKFLGLKLWWLREAVQFNYFSPQRSLTLRLSLLSDFSIRLTIAFG